MSNRVTTAHLLWPAATSVQIDARAISDNSSFFCRFATKAAQNQPICPSFRKVVVV